MVAGLRCNHNVVDYDGATGEYYCIECGDVVEKPKDWDDDEV